MTSEEPPWPIDPFFWQCLHEAAGNKDLVAQFDRLKGTNLLRKGPSINIMIDEATGKLEDDLKEFANFVRECIYDRLRSSS